MEGTWEWRCLAFLLLEVLLFERGSNHLYTPPGRPVDFSYEPDCS